MLHAVVPGDANSLLHLPFPRGVACFAQQLPLLQWRNALPVIVWWLYDCYMEWIFSLLDPYTIVPLTDDNTEASTYINANFVRVSTLPFMASNSCVHLIMGI